MVVYYFRIGCIMSHISTSNLCQPGQHIPFFLAELQAYMRNLNPQKSTIQKIKTTHSPTTQRKLFFFILVYFSLQLFFYVIYTQVCIMQGFPGDSVIKNLPANAGDVGLIPGLRRSPEEGMATHSSSLVWTVPWTEKPGGLQFMGYEKS